MDETNPLVTAEAKWLRRVAPQSTEQRRVRFLQDRRQSGHWHSKHQLTDDTRSDRSTDPYLGTILFYVNTTHTPQDCALANDIF
jgi:hypothetical protein